jgi:hypothetical protein
MSYRIDPDGYCIEDGCTRPKATGEQTCSQCLRLARAAGRPEAGGPEAGGPEGDGAGTGTPPTAAGLSELSPEVAEFRTDEPRLPRCIAYLSKAGDVITLELTGEPRFTEADVEAVAAVLSNRKLRKAA